ncbi:hypothetical protein SPRG_16166 [Saprolegnia parasitica CBS 223.65]|uniref:Uncharacterized protein n=1 Tax=Saprolegnia parasitica (strain CBS 223.65) TaxID=695850 RepID=A0A067BJY7_SAPPC|nr:hypothetical protein SPRG_16166 [Saprolegnia parasitica CBS 223.65]KDO18508.1 hypothetical protein SPRG_16166 [Saprolegnia parasitica CBS 223.65]|eukprot:XP_012210785.1 hypothetical protein SPRG_16166 [Saprolegnia parasitica CBS 223.65]
MATSSTSRYSKATEKRQPWRELDPMLQTLSSHQNTFTRGVSSRIQAFTELLIQSQRTYNESVRSVLQLCRHLVPLLEPNADKQALSNWLFKGQSQLPQAMAALNNVSAALAAARDQLPELEQALETLGRPLSNHLEAETAVWEATTLCCKGAAESIKAATAAVLAEKNEIRTIADAVKTAHFCLEWLRTDGSETDYDSWVCDAMNKLLAHCESYLRRFNSN